MSKEGCAVGGNFFYPLIGRENVRTHPIGEPRGIKMSRI